MFWPSTTPTASYTKPYDMFSHMPITIQNDILWDSDASTALSTACEVFELPSLFVAARGP